MSGKNKFFFEDDSDDTTLSDKDQAEFFGNMVAEAGVEANIDSMAPMEAVPEKMDVKKHENTILTIEYGIVGRNYVIHITPRHPQRNLSTTNKLNEAILVSVTQMNTKVPYDLKVDIFPPKPEWEVQALSFVVRDGAEAWNFDITDFEETVIKNIFESITKICMAP